MSAAVVSDAAERVDLAFPAQGDTLPRDHRAMLAAALAAHLPWLGVEPGTGVHRVNLVAGGGEQGLLSGRARLVLRVPRERSGAVALQLSGIVLDLGGERLELGAPQVRELLPHRTLYAHFVAGASADGDEAAFLAEVGAELDRLDVDARTVCGRRQQIHTERGIVGGFSLMLDGLGRDDALRVMRVGIGPHRALGCGLFIPHKSAAAVGD